MTRTSTAFLPAILLTGLLFSMPAPRAQITFDTPAATPSTNGPVKGKPYEADKRMHMKRSLADGTVTNHDVQIYEARDSSGRLLVESRMAFALSPSQPEKIFVFDRVMDPNAGTVLSWNNLTKNATLIHIPSPEMRALASAAVTGKAPSPPITNKPELLGQRMIHGLMTTGRRTQKSIPADTLGSATPTDTEREWWTDEDLHLVVLDTSRNPQHGEQTTELVDLKLTEPDPSRFHPPAGYDLHEINPHPASSIHLLGPSALPLDIANAPSLSHADALLKLSSNSTTDKRAGAAALVKEAQASSSISLKDDIAYRLARNNVGLAEALQLAEEAVHGAEAAAAIELPGAPSPLTQEVFERETTLSRYWHTLGYIYFRQGEDALATQYIESAWLLDPRGYYATPLGKLREASGNTDAAIQIYREALGVPGSQDEKDSLRERIEALSGIADAQPLSMPAILLDNATSAPAGTAFFDAIYTAAGNTPEVVFVSGDSALKPLAARIANTIANRVAKSPVASFDLPDKGPETIVRRMQFTCKAASSTTCQAQFLSVRQASDMNP